MPQVYPSILAHAALQNERAMSAVLTAVFTGLKAEDDSQTVQTINAFAGALTEAVRDLQAQNETLQAQLLDAWAQFEKKGRGK